MSKKILGLFIVAKLTTYAVGQEILNYYIDRDEHRSYQSYIEYENKAKKAEYVKWKAGVGSIEVNKNWTLDYDLERKVEKISDSEGWENTFSYYKKLKDITFFNKTWYTDVGPYLKYNVTKIPDSKDYKENKYGARYRIRTVSNIGKGEAYWGVDFLAYYMDTNNRDGVAIEANVAGSASLGYGFQDFFTIHNEYLDYDGNYGTYLFRVENTFRWSYDFNENFAISIENEIDSYNYYRNTDQKRSIKFTIGPYLLFNKNINENLRIFAKIGVVGYNYEKYESKNFEGKEEGQYIKSKIGFEYIF